MIIKFKIKVNRQENRSVLARAYKLLLAGKRWGLLLVDFKLSKLPIIRNDNNFARNIHLSKPFYIVNSVAKLFSSILERFLRAQPLKSKNRI